MLSNRLAFVGLATVCVTAAAAGSYIAVRQSTATTQPVATTAERAAATVGQTVVTSAPVEAGSPAALPLRHEALGTRETPTPSITSRTSAARSVAESRPEPVRSAGTQPLPASPAPIETTQAPVPTVAASAAIEPAPVVRDDEPRPIEPPAAAEPIRRAEELVVSADSVIGLKLETAVLSDRARVEDRVDARVARDVQVGGTVVIPAGSRVQGTVTLVERGGRLKEKARLGIRFNTLLLADGTKLPISTETVYRVGEERANNSAAKIGGGAAAGAILGAIIGGAKGAAIGGSIGAGAGTAAVMSGDPSIASFRAGTDITARILSPIAITVER